MGILSRLNPVNINRDLKASAPKSIKDLNIVKVQSKMLAPAVSLLPNTKGFRDNAQKAIDHPVSFATGGIMGGTKGTFEVPSIGSGVKTNSFRGSEGKKNRQIGAVIAAAFGGSALAGAGSAGGAAAGAGAAAPAAAPGLGAAGMDIVYGGVAKGALKALTPKAQAPQDYGTLDAMDYSNPTPAPAAPASATKMPDFKTIASVASAGIGLLLLIRGL